MATIRQEALAGSVTGRMAEVAVRESVDREFVRRGLADGSLAVTANKARLHVPPMAVGKGLRVKVNANIGTSPRQADLETERRKLAAALTAGADALMDLSVGGDLDAVRRMVLAECPVAVGTVPIYDAVARLRAAGKSLPEMTADDLFEAVARHVEEGVDFITVHCGVTRETLGMLRERPRVIWGWSAAAARCCKNGSKRPGARIRCTSISTGCSISPASTTPSSPSATGCGPAAWPTPPIRPNWPNWRCWAV